MTLNDAKMYVIKQHIINPDKDINDIENEITSIENNRFGRFYKWLYSVTHIDNNTGKRVFN